MQCALQRSGDRIDGGGIYEPTHLTDYAEPKQSASPETSQSLRLHIPLSHSSSKLAISGRSDSSVVDICCKPRRSGTTRSSRRRRGRLLPSAHHLHLQSRLPRRHHHYHHHHLHPSPPHSPRQPTYSIQLVATATARHPPSGACSPTIQPMPTILGSQTWVSYSAASSWCWCWCCPNFVLRGTVARLGLSLLLRDLGSRPADNAADADAAESRLVGGAAGSPESYGAAASRA